MCVCFTVALYANEGGAGWVARAGSVRPGWKVKAPFEISHTTTRFFLFILNFIFFTELLKSDERKNRASAAPTRYPSGV